MNGLHKKSGMAQLASATASSPRKELIDDNGHLWSVSYADLLMVLLSFFIIFFSVDQTKRNSIISQILTSNILGDAPKAANLEGKAGGSGGLFGSAVGTKLTTGAPLSLKEALNNAGILFVQEGDQLLLYFPENIFKSNEYILNPEQERRLRDIMTRLKPYEDKIDLTFVGSTDPTPIQRKTALIQNNFDLSALRASRAMMIAADSGFPISGLRMKASANYERASRTLSIQITAKGVVQ